MALLFMEGFDHYGSGASVRDYGKWSSGGPFAQVSTSNVRTGVGCLIMNNSNESLISNTLPASGGFVVGLAHRFTSSFVADNILQIREDTTVHLALAITAGGLLTVKRDTTVLATGTTVLSLNNWYYLEFKGTIHDTTGSYEVKIDGVSEAALTASSVDTRNAGTTGQWTRIRIGTTSGGSGDRFDDIYVCDTSGSSPRNTFLGSVKVDTLIPQTDAVAAGSNAGLTPSTGTDHGALVDEVGPNTTDFNSSATVGVKDTYNYPAMALTGTVLGVQTNLYVLKTDATARTICAVARSASTDSDGANISPTTGFLYGSTIFAQDPNAGSPIEWTTTTVGSAQFGMKVTS